MKMKCWPVCFVKSCKYVRNNKIIGDWCLYDMIHLFSLIYDRWSPYFCTTIQPEGYRMCSLSIVEDFQKNFLHGEVTIQILKAEDLCDKDDIAHNQTNASCIFLKRTFKFSKKLENPFVGVYLGNNCICQTSCHSNEYEFEINVPKISMFYYY